MDNGILKRGAYFPKKVELKGGSNVPFRSLEVYKHYILGFYSIRSAHGDCCIIDTQNGVFTAVQIGLDLPTKINYSVCHWKDNIFILYGGETQVQQVFDQTRSDVYSLRIITKENGNSIEKETYPLNDCQWWNSCHTAQIYEDNMYILGGKESKSGHFLDVWEFDLHEKTWCVCQTTGDRPKNRLTPGSVLFNNKIYIFGGVIKVGQGLFGSVEVMNDLFALDLKTMEWQKIHEKNFLPSNYLTDLRGSVVNEKIVISSPHFDEFVIYDPATNTTEKSQGLPPKDGFMIRSYRDHPILFRFISPSFGRSGAIEFQDLSIGGAADQTEKVEEKEEESVKIRKNLLPQTPHMQLLWKDKSFADVTFIVQNEEITAHRIILLKSHYFQTMFQSGMMESNSNKITVPDVSPVNFKAILEFIYFGKVSLTEKLALELIILADMYFLSDLKAECETYFSVNLSMKNFLDIMRAAETADSEKLQDKVASFLVTNLEKLTREIDITQIPQDLFVQAMRKMKQPQNNF